VVYLIKYTVDGISLNVWCEGGKDWYCHSREEKENCG